MRAEAVFAPLASAALAVAAAAVLELALRPRPMFLRPWRAWALHAGALCVVSGVLTALLGNPWLAAGFLTVLFLILVLVGNAKAASLDEPFVFQDYEYFTDMIRYPRLYIPFFGWGNFLVSVAGGLALLYFAVTEAGSFLRFDWRASLLGGGAVAALGLACIRAADRRPLSMSFDPRQDLRAHGFVACLWRYGMSGRTLPAVASPFEGLASPPFRLSRGPQRALPHMVAVQSESFFDPRKLYPGIRPEVLAEYDKLKAQSRAWGTLRVPAWGANTIRTEFSFLSGVDNAVLGAHRFNPFRAVARGWKVATLAAFLRGLGYRTVCIHPYSRSFYLRDKVMPRLGFDDFWGIERFAHAQRFGPYIGDTAVADVILETLQSASTPTFVFAITMENHGPLHLEKVGPEDERPLYTSAPPEGFEDLTVYLRHLRNADAMIGKLAAGANACGRPLELCWFGDHVPIMPKVYSALGKPCGDVEYVLWGGCGAGAAAQREIGAGRLAMTWLDHAGLPGSGSLSSSSHHPSNNNIKDRPSCVTTTC